MAEYDKIEKRLLLHAPRSRVWRALTDVREFAQWFGLKLEGEFVAGKPIAARFEEPLPEAVILEAQKRAGLPPSKVKLPENNTFCTVERIEPERYFSFRWIPYGVDAEIDPRGEPTTLVEFRLEQVAEGTLLVIVESGFEHVPERRRERAFRMNQGGWSAQAENLKNHVEGG